MPARPIARCWKDSSRTPTRRPPASRTCRRTRVRVAARDAGHGPRAPEARGARRSVRSHRHVAARDRPPRTYARPLRADAITRVMNHRRQERSCNATRASYNDPWKPRNGSNRSITSAANAAAQAPLGLSRSNQTAIWPEPVGCGQPSLLRHTAVCASHPTHIQSTSIHGARVRLPTRLPNGRRVHR